MSFSPSLYQQRIFDFVKNGKGNAVIEAVAGSVSPCFSFQAYVLELLLLPEGSR